MDGGKRHDDEIHEQVDALAVKYAGEQGVVDHEMDSAAGDPIDRGGAECDDEVKEESEHGRLPTQLDRSPSQQTAGDRLQDSDGWNVHKKSPGEEGLGNIKDAASKPAEEDGAGGGTGGGRHRRMVSLSMRRNRAKMPGP